MNTKKLGYVYCVINKVNGKLYIGRTIKTIESRWRSHIWYSKNKRSGMLISRSIAKYGVNNFLIFKLWCGEIALVNVKEIEYIKKFGSIYPNGYNLTYGGDGMLGRQVSEETKLKISNSNKGRIVSEETRLKQSKAHKGVPKSEAHKKLMLERQIGRKLSESTKLKMSNSKKGKKLSEELKKHFSETRKGNLNANFGNHYTDETRNKISLKKRSTKLYKFYNILFGIVECTQYELRITVVGLTSKGLKTTKLSRYEKLY